MFATALVAACKRVDGVARLKSDFSFRIRNLFRRIHGGLAVKKVNYNTIIIEVCLVSVSGYTAADLSYRIQEAVLAVASNKNFTELRVKRVDVRICDVERPTYDREVEQQIMSGI